MKAARIAVLVLVVALAHTQQFVHAASPGALQSSALHLQGRNTLDVSSRQLQQQTDKEEEQLDDDFDGQDDNKVDPAFGEEPDQLEDEDPVQPQTQQQQSQQQAQQPGVGQKAQDQGSKRVKPAASSKSKIVDQAPEVTVAFGDDIDDEGRCKVEIEKYCKDVEEGDGKLAECVSSLIAASDNPEAKEGDEEAPVISDGCRDEIYEYKIQRNTNINKNIPLAKACKADVAKHCNTTLANGYAEGLVIACLRQRKAKLSKQCQKELTKAQQDAAEDIRADPALWEVCKDDATTLCKDVKFGQGRVQACLREKRGQLSWTCHEELFRQEMENADDIRLSVRLYAKCMPDKRKFCKDVEPGQARTKDCLEEHRDKLSQPCKEEIDAMIERRVEDFRLDPKLKSACETDISTVCNWYDDVEELDSHDTAIINCLQDLSNELQSQECKRQVKKYLVLASQDIRFDASLAEACYEDRNKFCANVPPGSARVIRCLTRQREKLSSTCRVQLFDEELRFGESIDFQYPMKEACRAELNKYCKDVPHGNARAIRCLQEHKKEKEFGKACKDEVKAYENEMSKDYRFNYRLKKNCEKDIDNLCKNVCSSFDGSVCGGKVLRCLTDKTEDIKAEACKAEVFYYQKMEVENFQNDIILAEACRDDVEKLCKDVEPGEGRVHKCLRDNRSKLSESCRREELLLEEKEMNNIELAQGLLRSCKAERQLFCRDVRPGSARVFRCLAENMNDPDFGTTCKDQVIYKLQRRQSNWKLDPPLRKACRQDVGQYCSQEDGSNSEEGLVYKCLIRNVASISSGCQRELGRAVHMALFVWQPDAILTKDCDADIEHFCLAARPNMADRPGAVGSCLASILERQDQMSAGGRRRLLDKDDEGTDKEFITTRRVDDNQDNEDDNDATVPSGHGNTATAMAGARLSEQCYILADIAEPPNMKQAFDASLSVAALLSHIDRIDQAAGNVGLVNRNSRGRPESISLTGGVAMLGMAALVTLVAYGSYTVYRRWKGIPDRDGYTLVVKPRK